MVVRVPCISPDVSKALALQAPAVLPKPRRGHLLAAHRGKVSSQEYSVAHTKDPNQKQSG